MSVVNMLLYTAIGLGVVVIVSYVAGVYNTEVRLTRTIEQSFANLEVFLKQRHDELAKLVNTCQAYMQHERGVLNELTRLRTGYDIVSKIEEKIGIENQLNQVLDRLRHVWEGYPDLKASQNFMFVQERISGLEASISDQRQLFNASVTQHNIFISQFPALLVARSFHYLEKPLLEIPKADQTDNLAPFLLQRA
ncbi:MAG: LemA family protein [Candidatus Binatia bacterium]